MCFLRADILYLLLVADVYLKNDAEFVSQPFRLPLRFRRNLPRHARVSSEFTKTHSRRVFPACGYTQVRREEPMYLRMTVSAQWGEIDAFNRGDPLDGTTTRTGAYVCAPPSWFQSVDIPL